MASAVIALYVLSFLSGRGAFISGITISLMTLGCAATAIVVSVVGYLWLPKKYQFGLTLGSFLLVMATAAALILDTGGTHSSFIALWMIVGVFSGIFGLYSLGPFAAATIAYTVLLLSQHALSDSALVALLFTGILPIGVSYLIWHDEEKASQKGEQAYRELATELSQVAGKSEVVINAIADGVIAVNASGIIELINPAAQQIIGWGKQDALKLDYRSVLKLVNNKNEDLDEAQDPVAQVLATNKEVTNNNLSLVTNSGKNILVSLLISPVGQIGSGAIIVFRDITREKAEERQQAEFISTASHEMRTPVASIEGYLGLALNPATATIDDRARDFIIKAHESAQHLGRLFQDLLDVSKADDGRMQNDPKVINLVETCHDIVEGLRPKAYEKGLRLIYKPKPDDDGALDRSDRSEKTLSPIYYVNVDPDHLREVVANLVENAIKYTLNGEVVVDISGDPENVQISIQDSGIGIPPEDVGHLFQKFYRVDNSETREIGGTGLGLYLCRRLVETMQGRIWVESKYKQGSTFFVSLPRLANDEAQRMIEQSNTKETPKIVKARTMTAMPTSQSAEQPIDTIEIPQPVQMPSQTTPPQPQIQPQAQPQPQAPVFTPGQNYVAPPDRPRVAVQPLSPTAPGQPLSQAQPSPQSPIRPTTFASVGTPADIQKRPLGATPTQPQPAAQAPISMAPAQPFARPNIPLSQIEQNKAAYVSQRPSSVAVPSRDQNQTPQN